MTVKLGDTRGYNGYCKIWCLVCVPRKVSVRFGSILKDCKSWPCILESHRLAEKNTSLTKSSIYHSQSLILSAPFNKSYRCEELGRESFLPFSSRELLAPPTPPLSSPVGIKLVNKPFPLSSPLEVLIFSSS